MGMSANPAVPEVFDWRVARACDSGGCVGVARQGEFVLVGNTSSPGAPVSRFTREEWAVFVAGVKLGDFDDISLALSRWLIGAVTSANAPATAPAVAVGRPGVC